MHLSPVYHIQLPLLALSKSKTAFFFTNKKTSQVERETRTESLDLNCSASRRLTTNQNHVPAWKFLATKNCWLVLKGGFRNPVSFLGTFQNPTRCQSDYISQKKCGPCEWPLMSNPFWILIQTVELGLDPGPTVQLKLHIAANDRVIFITEWWRLLGDTCMPFGVPCVEYITEVMPASQEEDIPLPFSALGVKVALYY